MERSNGSAPIAIDAAIRPAYETFTSMRPGGPGRCCGTGGYAGYAGRGP